MPGTSTYGTPIPLDTDPAGDLADSVRDVVDSLEAGWTAFAPAWTASVTNPVLGNGVLTGRYKRIGRTVHFTITLSPGSTTTFGSGTYLFSLPFAAVNMNDPRVFPALIFDTSGPVRRGAMGTLNTTTTILLLDAASTGSGIVSNTVPWVWANGDTIRISGTYEAA